MRNPGEHTRVNGVKSTHLGKDPGPNYLILKCIYIIKNMIWLGIHQRKHIHFEKKNIYVLESIQMLSGLGSFMGNRQKPTSVSFRVIIFLFLSNILHTPLYPSCCIAGF